MDVLYVVGACGVPLALVALLLFVIVRMRRGRE